MHLSFTSLLSSVQLLANYGATGSMTGSVIATSAHTMASTSLKIVSGVRTRVLLLLFAPSSSMDRLCNTLSQLWALQLRGPLWPLHKSHQQLPSQLMLWTASLTTLRSPARGSISGELQVCHYIPVHPNDGLRTYANY
jgi:hypothetical protein